MMSTSEDLSRSHDLIRFAEDMLGADLAEHIHYSYKTLFLEGFFRPVIGAAFAGLSLAILASGLFAPAPGTEQVLALVVTIAFVAGFSERFDQTLIAKAEAELVGSAYATPES